MPVDGLFVERVDLRRLGGFSGGINFLCDSFDGHPLSPGEKQFGPLARKGACDSTAESLTRVLLLSNLMKDGHLPRPGSYSLAMTSHCTSIFPSMNSALSMTNCLT
jgi:hypothetical protein